ncbi:Fungal specific transcription factor domain protein [Ceratocystis platani]|uniref:Fungal specific transcription factor domain protein n=1 Tax=Ceratocystis fimbriata f. sp. platani TaxID=88771 RepID=A0A0F8DA91_CERFI|nr:Fungal specific transcription factor domain protein [Ceratocystis platani]
MEKSMQEVPVEDLTPEEANRIIHSHRKVRYGVDEYEGSQEARYLGQNSIPELLREQQQSPKDDDDNSIRYEMRPILGLDTSAPFPLMSAAHIDRLAQDILAELPSDREVMKLFRTYREICQPFWGFVIDVGDLENKLMVYLEERARNAKNSTRSSKPISASWLAILFAVLAVGSQYHDSPYHIRTRDSQKYIQTSFHFLRIGNFLLRPTFDAIQALLLTSFVLLNDMKAEASWGLLGLTCRLAQSLGIHRQTMHGSEPTPSFSLSEPNPREMIRLLAGQPNANWNYLEGLYHLIQIIRDRLNPDVAARATYQTIVKDCQEIEVLRTHMAPNIRDKDKCRTALDRLQHYAIRLHTSFILSVIPTRSWAFTYNGLSSALLLGILCETKTDPEVRQLQGDLIAALSATAAKEQSPPPPGPVRKTDRDIDLATTMPNVQSTVPLDGMSRNDPNTNNISPMDLYESIWWESPESWNAAVDQMPFDFMHQPPPGQTPQQQFYF